MTDNRTAQAARAQAGTNLESVVAQILNLLLSDRNIFVIKGSLKELRRVLQDDALAAQIIEYSTLPVKRPCDQKQISDYPDSDLFVVYKDATKWRVLGIISCKVSFHARHTEVAFWGLLIRPKLLPIVGVEAPMTEKTEEADASSSEAKKISYRLRLQVLNKRREIARNCKVFCDAVYAEMAGGTGFYPVRKFVPTALYWTTADEVTDVVKKLPSFVNLAELSLPDESVSEPMSGSRPEASFSLQIQVEADGVKGRFLRVGKEKVLVPLILYADNLRHSQKYFVEICWRGKGPQDFSPSNFQIRLLTESQGESLIGGAQ